MNKVALVFVHSSPVVVDDKSNLNHSTNDSTQMNSFVKHFKQPFPYNAKYRYSIVPTRCHLRRQPRRLPPSSSTPSCKLANLLAAVISIHNGPLSTDFAHVHRPNSRGISDSGPVNQVLLTHSFGAQIHVLPGASSFIVAGIGWQFNLIFNTKVSSSLR